MNVLFICSATSWGGNEKWTLTAASGLAARGHQVFLACHPSLFADRAAGSAVELVPLPFPKFRLGHANWVRGLSKVHRIGVVIPTKQREYLPAALGARFAGSKSVARLGIVRPIRGWKMRLAFCRLLNGVIVNSQSICRTLGETRSFDRKKCLVLYNGVRLPDLDVSGRAQKRSELGLTDGDFAILGVGRLTSQKGFDRAIQALVHVDARAKLLLAGDGDPEALYDFARKLGVEDRVEFLGFRTDIHQLLQAVDLFWLTSRSEGMPNALLEAMAAGRASCSFDVAGVAELVTNGVEGYVLPEGDVAVLAARTNELLQDKGRRTQMESAARTTVAERFTVEAMVDQLDGYLAVI